MIPSSFARIAPLFALFALGACKTADLSSGGARVAAVHTPLGAQCQPIGYFVGQGGGYLFGGFLSNESLTDYAVNSLRNKAAKTGATHVLVDRAPLGRRGEDLSTVTISGTGYKCPAGSVTPTAMVPVAPAVAASQPAPAPAPAATVAPSPEGI